MMRTVLRHCFGLSSASVYPLDLGGNKPLERYVGHLEPLEDGRLPFPADAIPLIKTHELPVFSDRSPAIYIVRDGRAACLSIWNFYQHSIPLEKIISGRWRVGSYRFGRWSHHVQSWRPWDRPNTILIRYEDLTDNLASVIDRLGGFLARQPIANAIPKREDIASVDGQWVRNARRGQDSFPPELKDLFNRHNGAMMQQLGYGNE
jgi:hypothetical protein